jgi:hypothetical protein
MRSPSVGPVDRFERQPEYPQVLNGLEAEKGFHTQMRLSCIRGGRASKPALPRSNAYPAIR